MKSFNANFDLKGASPKGVAQLILGDNVFHAELMEFLKIFLDVYKSQLKPEILSKAAVKAEARAREEAEKEQKDLDQRVFSEAVSRAKMVALAADSISDVFVSSILQDNIDVTLEDADTLNEIRIALSRLKYLFGFENSELSESPALSELQSSIKQSLPETIPADLDEWKPENNLPQEKANFRKQVLFFAEAEVIIGSLMNATHAAANIKHKQQQVAEHKDAVIQYIDDVKADAKVYKQELDRVFELVKDKKTDYWSIKGAIESLGKFLGKMEEKAESNDETAELLSHYEMAKLMASEMNNVFTPAFIKNVNPVVFDIYSRMENLVPVLQDQAMFQGEEVPAEEALPNFARDLKALSQIPVALDSLKTELDLVQAQVKEEVMRLMSVVDLSGYPSDQDGDTMTKILLDFNDANLNNLIKSKAKNDDFFASAVAKYNDLVQLRKQFFPENEADVVIQNPNRLQEINDQIANIKALSAIQSYETFLSQQMVRLFLEIQHMMDGAELMTYCSAKTKDRGQLTGMKKIMDGYRSEEPHTEIKDKAANNRLFAMTLAKYDALDELKQSILPAVGVVSSVKNAAPRLTEFHNTRERVTKRLDKSRDSAGIVVAKWFAVVSAFIAGMVGGAFGLGIGAIPGAYYAAKKAHNNLFSTKTKRALEDVVDQENNPGKRPKLN